MKTKKTVIAVLLVSLLISVAFIAGCIDPVVEGLSAKPKAETGAEAEENYQVPAGKGVVRFKFADTDSRTILPDTTGFSSYYYEIAFASTTPANETANNKTILKDYTDATAVIVLNEDTYTVAITAFDDSSKTTALAGWTGQVTISSSTPATANVNLKGIVNGDDKGYFDYDITIPSGTYNVNTLYITGANEPTFAPITITADGNNQTPSPLIELNSGYYVVKLTVSKTGYQTQEFVRVLHIYPTMTSTMDSILVPNLVRNTFDVSFDPNGAGTISITNGSIFTTVSKLYGDLIISPTAPVPANSYYTFDDWYKESSHSTKWNFSTDRVFADTVLYANFTTGTPTTIDSLAIGGVTVPATGGTPVSTITSTAQYTGTVEWKETSGGATLNGNFAASTAYTAIITLTAETGYTLTGVGANTFTVQGADTVTHAANSGVITANFPATAAPVATGNVTFTITFTASDAGSITSGNGSTIDRSDFFDGTSTYIFTIGTAPGGGSWSDESWNVGNVIKTGSSVTLAKDTDYNTVVANNTFEITVTATLSGSSDGTKPNGTYSATVLITVQP